MKIKTFIKSKWTIGGVVLLALFAGYWFFIRKGGAAYQLITVTRGSITETVSATGNTTPAKSVSLSFQNSGTIARVNYELGDYVSAGTIVAELNTENLAAALAQARASLAAAEANLAALVAGTRSEQLAIYENTVAQDQVALANAIASAYAVSDSAVHVSADQMFVNPRTSGATFAFTIPDVALTTTIAQERVALEPVLTAWAARAAAPAADGAGVTADAAQTAADLAQVSTFLNDVAAALAKTPVTTTLSSATLTTYQSNIATARSSVSSALSALATAKAAFVSAQGTLTLAQAGSTPESIAAQRAQVEQAQAGVANALANLRGAQIIAPLSGVVTQLDAKVGQLATPGAPLVSIIGAGGFEVDAGISETDIGKITVGDKMAMTLDAFSGETFSGSVFYIAPAQTNTQGVISYLIKVAFDKADARLKSGLTANLDIATKHKDDVLILPQYAILQNDNGTFVETPVGKESTTTPVTLGIQDMDGNVEVVSGVTEGQQVINIGLRTP